MCPRCRAVRRTRLEGTRSCVSASRTVGLCSLLCLLHLRLLGGGIQAEVKLVFLLGIGSSCSSHVWAVSVVVVFMYTLATRRAASTSLFRHLSSHSALAHSFHCAAPATNVQQRRPSDISHGSADTPLAEGKMLAYCCCNLPASRQTTEQKCYTIEQIFTRHRLIK